MEDELVWDQTRLESDGYPERVWCSIHPSSSNRIKGYDNEPPVPMHVLATGSCARLEISFIGIVIPWKMN